MYKTYECCPEYWRRVQDKTGSFELDGWVSQCKNQDMRRKLFDFTADFEVAYKKRTGYGVGLD